MDISKPNLRHDLKINKFGKPIERLKAFISK